jgi:hypothetical protein
LDREELCKFHLSLWWKKKQFEIHY